MVAGDMWTHSADVVVVGGGGAGMAAAVSAAETDPSASVLVLQKLGHLGGSTTIAMGTFSAAGTQLQERRGIPDSPTAHFRDIDAFVESHSRGSGRYFYINFQGDLAEKDNLELRRLLVDHGGETLEWLRAQGCEYAGPYLESGHSVPRVHQIVPDTEAYADVLGDRIDDLDVEIRYETEAYELVADENGVEGVLAHKRGRTSPLVVEARRGVVLATGDYVNSQELRAEYTTNDAAPAINEENTGDGHLMARDIGAELVNMDVQEFFMRVGEPLYTNPEFPAMVEEGAILVDDDGRRFVNESSDYEQVFEATLRRDCRQAYVVFDHGVAEEFTAWPDHISTLGKNGKLWAYLDDYLDTDYLHRGDSPSEAAERAGIASETLAETVTAYNEGVDVDGITVDPFGRRRGRKPLTDPPYYVLGPVRPYSVITDGGIAVDTDFRALQSDGTPIDGLYVAGAAAGDVLLFGHGHHLSWTFTSGRFAGREAVSAAGRS